MICVRDFGGRRVNPLAMSGVGEMLYDSMKEVYGGSFFVVSLLFY